MEKENKLLDRKRLKEELDNYRNILSSEMLDYLNSLIGLEVSSLNEMVLSLKTMNRLNELEIYRLIVIYNVYYRILNAVHKDSKICCSYNPNAIEIFCMDEQNNQYNVFQYFIKEKSSPVISFEQFAIDKRIRNEQIKWLYKELESAKNAKDYSKLKSPHLNNMILKRSKEHDKIRVNTITDLIDELNARKGLVEQRIKDIISKQGFILKQILREEGLQISEPFTEKSHDKIDEDLLLVGDSLNYKGKVDNAMTRTLVKNYPNLLINKNIKYF